MIDGDGNGNRNGNEPPEEEIDPEEFGKILQEVMSKELSAGNQKYCIRAKRCARNMTCEHAQTRDVTTETLDLFQGKSPDLGDCSNWIARKELNTGLDLPRRVSGGASRHNQHADRARAQDELLRKIDRGEKLPFSSHTPEELKNMLEDSRRRRKK